MAEHLHVVFHGVLDVVMVNQATYLGHNATLEHTAQFQAPSFLLVQLPYTLQLSVLDSIVWNSHSFKLRFGSGVMHRLSNSYSMN